MTQSHEAQRSSFEGFTLTELIVAIVVIGILFTFIVPAAWKSIESGRAVACLSNLRQISVGLTSYLADHDATMPTMKAGRMRLSEEVPVLDNTLDKYIQDKQVFLCPSDPKMGKLSGTSYYWNVTLNGQRLGSLDFMKITAESSKIPVLSDKESFHPYLENKVNILYADGHATKDLKFLTDTQAE
jgi:prepilin-type N-terminal cleavage/methylation domain-containing protein/prepilin-type processing-associated H-X9-DG protein